MPCHVGAAIAAVAGYSGAQGCEGAEQTLSEDDYEKSQVPLEVDPNASPSAAASPLARGYLGNEDIGSPVHLSGRSVRFSERMVGSEGVRSMYSERPSNNLHRHMEVRLRVSLFVLERMKTF